MLIINQYNADTLYFFFPLRKSSVAKLNKKHAPIFRNKCSIVINELLEPIKFGSHFTGMVPKLGLMLVYDQHYHSSDLPLSYPIMRFMLC